jgi:hypothetical protein
MNSSDLGMYAVAIMCICAPLVILASVQVVVFLVVIQRGRRFDSYFTPLGFTASMFTFTGRQYRGTVNGRPVHIKLYRNLGLHFELRSSVGTRFAIGSRTALAKAASGFLGRSPIPLNDPAFGHLAASASDAGWAHALLADPTAREAILRLTHCEAPLEWRMLTIQPGQLLMQMYRFRLSLLTVENVRTWLDDLVAFTEAAEKLPLPSGTPSA